MLVELVIAAVVVGVGSLVAYDASAWRTFVAGVALDVVKRRRRVTVRTRSPSRMLEARAAVSHGSVTWVVTGHLERLPTRTTLRLDERWARNWSRGLLAPVGAVHGSGPDVVRGLVAVPQVAEQLRAFFVKEGGRSLSVNERGDVVALVATRGMDGTGLRLSLLALTALLEALAAHADAAPLPAPVGSGRAIGGATGAPVGVPAAPDR